jgi:hypothetical protein
MTNSQRPDIRGEVSMSASASAYDWTALPWWDTAPDASERVELPTPTGPHRFISSDDCIECLTCGGVWDAIGAEPTPCTQNVSMVHGDRRENGHDLDCPGGVLGSCESCDALCNCALCA